MVLRLPQCLPDSIVSNGGPEKEEEEEDKEEVDGLLFRSFAGATAAFNEPNLAQEIEPLQRLVRSRSKVRPRYDPLQARPRKKVKKFNKPSSIAKRNGQDLKV